jgi:hypothetical protein
MTLTQTMSYKHILYKPRATNTHALHKREPHPPRASRGWTKEEESVMKAL